MRVTPRGAGNVINLSAGKGAIVPKRGSKGRSPLGGGGGAAASHNPPPFGRGQGVGQSLHNFPKVDDIAYTNPFHSDQSIRVEPAKPASGME